MKWGKNFNESPLSFEEFISPDDIGFATYNNFFSHLYLKEDWVGKNYERLKMIHPELAKELSTAYSSYALQGRKYPEDVLRKGHEAYLLLREMFSDDPELLGVIKRYNERLNEKIPDDFPAFFA